MTEPVISTPRGAVYLTAEGKAELKWNAAFAAKWTKIYSKAQVFVDSEVLRLCEPYIPLRTGTLIKTGILGTELGSGTVSWIAPYAAYQYYMTNRKTRSETGPLRGSYWFDRMWTSHGWVIMAGAKRIMRESSL